MSLPPSPLIYQNFDECCPLRGAPSPFRHYLREGAWRPADFKYLCGLLRDNRRRGINFRCCAINYPEDLVVQEDRRQVGLVGRQESRARTSCY